MSPLIPKSTEVTTPETPVVQNGATQEAEQVKNSVENILSKEAKEGIQ